ncbi:hypothetical protein [Streptomyces sp. NPDC057877]|uniref:hypothetical protein n=1 Tax=Streptomyces sp. NPDC057877 TaxID=3346269 RepID=UPI00368C3439
MGIESDKVVYEYLSRVGDVAQQRQLPSAARMRLVSQLRDEIDRRRAKAVIDNPASVRRILARIGSPDDVVTAADSAADSGGAQSKAPSTARAVPARREPERTAPAASPPHRAGEHELGDSSRQPDWWRVDSSPFGVGDQVDGFVGGVEVPELFRPPGPRKAAEGSEKAAETAAEPEPESEPESGTRKRRLRLPALGRWSNPLLLLAAALLVVGAVLRHPVYLAFGWLIAYLSRRLTPTEMKIAVIGLPSLAVAGGVVWLWGRENERWGTRIAEGAMNDAIGEAYPWVVRGAAVASALFLVWRSQRRR